MHAHLLPAAWPLVMRGASLLPVLVGRRSVAASVVGAAAGLAHARARDRDLAAHGAPSSARRIRTFAALPIDVCWPATPAAGAGRGGRVRRPGFALIVGRLSSEDRYKGHDLLIDVWPDVAKGRPDARLVVAGTGDDAARLRARAERRGWATRASSPARRRRPSSPRSIATARFW